MTLRFSKKEKLITVSAILLIVGILAAVYFLYLLPKKNELDLKEKELKTVQQLLSVVQSKVNETESITLESTLELQKNVPVKPLLEALVLNVEKAEVVSGSFVVSMSFADSEITKENATEIEENVEAQNDEKTENEATNDTDKKNQSKESNLNKKTILLPSGVKKITINLSVESPTYFELEKFIQTLEDNQRIIVVESIEFNGSEEITSLEQQLEPLTYNIAVSAFYMPTLTDLQDKLPQIEVPLPSNKKNPLHSFTDFTEKDQDNNLDN